MLIFFENSFWDRNLLEELGEEDLAQMIIIHVAQLNTQQRPAHSGGSSFHNDASYNQSIWVVFKAHHLHIGGKYFSKVVLEFL